MTQTEAKEWLKKEIKNAEMFGKHAEEYITRSYRKTELEDLLSAFDNTVSKIEVEDVLDRIDIAVTAYEAADDSRDYDKGYALYEEVVDISERLTGLLS